MYIISFCLFQYEVGLSAFFDAFFRHDALADIVAARYIKHDVEHDPFDDGAKPTGTGIAPQRFLGNGLKSFWRKFEIYVIHGQHLLILLDQGVLRFCQDMYHRIFIERIEGNQYGQAANQFRDEAELLDLFRG